jgi:hypothetical protein
LPNLNRLHLLALVTACSSLLACSGAADIPATPDLTALNERYNNPTAALDQTQAVDALQEMPSLRELVAGFRAAGYAQDGVNRGSAEASQSSASRLNVQGSLDVDIRCPGELAEPAYSGNGTLALTIGVQKNLIKRGIGALADHCVLRGDLLGTPVRVEVDGPLAIDLGRDLSLRNPGTDRLLMSVTGSITVADYELRNLSARWTHDSLEYLFVLQSGGWIIAIVSADGSITLRDKDSLWGCSDGQTCEKL